MQGACHESKVHDSLERERSGEIQLQCYMEEQQCGLSYDVSSAIAAIENYYMEDISNMNEDGGRSATPGQEVAEFNKCKDNTIEKQPGMEEDIVALVHSGHVHVSMQKGRQKKRSKDNCDVQEAPRTRR